MSGQDHWREESRDVGEHNGIRIHAGEHLLKVVRDGKEQSIPLDNIIAVVPRSGGTSQEYSILYTTNGTDSVDGEKSSPYVFDYLKINDPPRGVLDLLGASEDCDWFSRSAESTERIIRHVIVSTGSGTGLAPAVWQNLVKPLLDYVGLVEQEHYELHFTESETSVTELIEESVLPKANDGVHQAILLLSGDGGIVDIVNALLRADAPSGYRKPTVSLLPLGTGNAIANSSGINSDHTLGLSTMMRGSPKEVPLFRAVFSSSARLVTDHGESERALSSNVDGQPVAYGAVVCSWGLHAAIVADSDTVEYRKAGAERFKLAGKEALFPSDGAPPHAYQAKVSFRRSGQKEWTKLDTHDHGYVLATLASQLEAGFTISPATKPLDGKLQLVYFGQLDGREAMDIMSKAYAGGKHVEDERIMYTEIEELKIEFLEEDARWRRVCVDGKIIRCEEGGWVKIPSGIGGVVDLVTNA